MKLLNASIIGLIIALSVVSSVDAKPKTKVNPKQEPHFWTTTEPAPKPTRLTDPCSFQYCGVVIPETPRKSPRRR